MQSVPSDKDLRIVVSRWSKLPEEVKRGIILLVNAAVKEQAEND
jgi:hypothetical protein